MKVNFTKLWAYFSGYGGRLMTVSACALLLTMFAQHSYAQTTVTGTVTDAETGEPLPGVNVLIKGTGTGATTNLEGEYRVQAPGSDAVLVFSFIGYTQQEVRVGNQTTINVSLQPDIEQLDEVVVVGYGTQRKADITGAVSTVDAEEMKKFATNDVAQLLQGRASGVAVTTDGQPGAVPNVRIRGVGTFGDAQPLYVVDGVPVATTPRDLNPNDIESMQVLKDASAGAIYGSRAANGVVIITTRQGRKNTPLRVEYNGYYGVDQVWQRIPVTNREQYQMLQNETQVNGGQTLAPGNDPNSPYFIDHIDTDWQEEGIKLGWRQNHNMVFSGGGEITTYNVSLDWFGNEGTFVGNGPDYNRYSARINTTSEKGIFRVGTNLFYAHSFENHLTFRGDILFGGRPPLIGDLVTAIPTMPVHDPNRLRGFGGTRSEVERAITLNAIGFNSIITNYTEVDRIFGTGWGELDLVNTNGHSLTYKLNLSYDKTIARDYSFQPTFDLGFFFQTDISRLSEGYRNIGSGLVENTLTYEKAFGRHNVTALVGHMYQQVTNRFTSGYSEQLTEPYFPVLNNGINRASSGNLVESALDSYLSRVNYSYDDRYLLTATVRRDGSSRFAPDYRYGNFPSIALGWKLHNEDFLQLPAFIDQLKLRGSYGALGNQNIGDYQYFSTINPNVLYNFGGQTVVGAIAAELPAYDIRWETKTTSNVGFDAMFLEGKFNFTAEYYHSETRDILVGVPVPLSTGAMNPAPITNAGTLRNSGFEFEAGYHKFTGDFTFDISANAYTLRNEVVSLGGNDEPIFGAGSRTMVGSEIGTHFGWDAIGIFQSQEEVEAHAFQSAATAPGDLIFRDINGDGVIDAEDRIELGSAMPSIYYGLNITTGYKNFDLTVFASGQGGYLINSRLYRDLMHTQEYLNYHEDMLNRWTPENPNTSIPRVVAGDPNQNMRNSNREGWLQNGTHLRLNTVSLGYKLPEGTIRGLSSARVYATAQNLYTFQGYKSYNPDFTSGTFNPGFDFGSFPRPRTMMFGVQLAF